jgi:hypothetical protein
MQEHQKPARVSGADEVMSVDAVLENVLRHMPQGHRLHSCSLVCTRWKAAALYMFVTSEQGVVAAAASHTFLRWLRRHGTGLRSLTVNGGSLYDDQLPLQGYSSILGLHQVTRLELEGMRERPKLLSAIGNCMTVRC